MASIDLTRRGLAASVCSVLFESAPSEGAAATDRLTLLLAGIEQRIQGRLGVFVREAQTGICWTWRPDERFPLMSTFKVFACAALLARVDAGQEDLASAVHYTANDVVPYSPVTERYVSTGMTLRAVCEAAMSLSDNTAGNLILTRIGGPAGFTRFMRSICDQVTRLDRYETALNEATPGDVRDTTSPRAAACSLSRLVLGDTLSRQSRGRLIGWMQDNKAGGPLLRAGLPLGWIIVDRTGAGGYGSRGDLAIIWPPRRKLVVAAVYLTDTKLTMPQRDAAIAEVGRALADTIARSAR